MAATIEDVLAELYPYCVLNRQLTSSNDDSFCTRVDMAYHQLLQGDKEPAKQILDYWLEQRTKELKRAHLATPEMLDNCPSISLNEVQKAYPERALYLNYLRTLQLRRALD